jgi:hypothetical protein
MDLSKEEPESKNEKERNQFYKWSHHGPKTVILKKIIYIMKGSVPL